MLQTSENAFAAMSTYSRVKDDLVRCIDDMLLMEFVGGCPCDELREKVGTNTFNLVVVGQFKRGKTSLINALLGAEILPVAVVPLTSIVTIMKYGEALGITVHFNDGRRAEINPGSLPEYVTERGNPKNEKDVSEVVVTYPSPWLRGGVQIIDTPGVGSVYEHNTDVAYQYLPKSDAALFLLSVDQPLGKAELDFLRDVREYSSRIFFLLNKADYFSAAELRESMDFSKQILNEAMSGEVRIYPVSAKLALEGKLSDSGELLSKSLLPQFSAVLNTFLIEEKGRVLLLSVANNLLRLLSQARFGLELEMKSLGMPVEELKKKIERFGEKKADVLSEKGDFDILLDGEIKRISKNMIDGDLNSFGSELRVKAERGLEQYYREEGGSSLRELRGHLEDHIVSGVRQAVNTWRVIEEEKLTKAFQAVCSRFIFRIDETVDSLLRFSSELFAVPYDAVKAEALWSTKSRFYYRFAEQPVGLEIITSSVTLALPRFIGEKIILKKMREYLDRVITMQLARIGSDFEERMQKSKLDFRWEMLERIEATLEGIGAAIEKGAAKHSRSEKEVTGRKKEASEMLGRIDETKDRIVKLKAELDAISRN